LCEGTQSDDVTEAEAADTQQLMTCRKYGWSASSNQLYDNKLQPVELQQQQPQHVEDAATGGDASNHDEQQHRHRR